MWLTIASVALPCMIALGELSREHASRRSLFTPFGWFLALILLASLGTGVTQSLIAEQQHVAERQEDRDQIQQLSEANARLEHSLLSLSGQLGQMDTTLSALLLAMESQARQSTSVAALSRSRTAEPAANMDAILAMGRQSLQDIRTQREAAERTTEEVRQMMMGRARPTRPDQNSRGTSTRAVSFREGGELTPADPPSASAPPLIAPPTAPAVSRSPVRPGGQQGFGPR